MSADSAPLLSSPSADLPPLIKKKGHRQHPSLDDTIEHCIADFGWTQIFQTMLVSFAWFFDAQQTFISVFTDAEPKWSCVAGDGNSSSICRPDSNLCHLPREAWSWDFPANTSVISEWSLQCAGSLVTGLPASAFFLGCLVGGFALATLADSSLGRKNMLVLSSLVMSVTGVLTAFSTNVWMYSALRFVCGFGRATVGTCALVLSTELVGKKWRENIGVAGFICFTLGFLTLPLAAFLLEGSSWRSIYLWTCIPSVLYSFLVFFLVRESPRWLFIKGRKDEFADTLRCIASVNRSSLTPSFFGRCTQWDDNSQTEPDVFAAMKTLVNRGWSCRRMTAVMVVGFGIGMVYYGMPLGLGNLSINLYLSVILNAIAEFPAALVTFFLIDKLNRKGAVLGLSVLSGFCSVGCVLVTWKGTQIVLELMSFFSACAAYDILMIYTMELFPTCVRNSAVSMVRQALVLGGAVSPVLVAAGRSNGVLSFGVFGVMIAACGLFVVCLPETRGRVPCDTMEEEENRDAALRLYCV